MPSFEEIEQFFTDFSQDMKNLGVAVMDNFVYYWEAPTTDELMDIEVADQESTDDERD